MVAPAPGLFSTMTASPKRLDSSCAIRRIGPSTAPPGENGTITRIGLDGYACASAVEADRERATAAARAANPILDRVAIISALMRQGSSRQSAWRDRGIPRSGHVRVARRGPVRRDEEPFA